MNSPSPVSRRSFLITTTAATSALATGGFMPAAAAPSTNMTTRSPENSFPRDFWWGAATASYQVEGATLKDDRGPSIWDTFSHQPGKIQKNDTGDVACDFYHRYPEDIKRMADLGVKHFRFSIAWSRIIPAGRGAVNEKGVDFYRRLTDALLAQGITPHATLYHWDLPQALQDRYGGWESREVVADFGDYASVVARKLGDRITHWMTLNEIESFVGDGYGIDQAGYKAPGITLKTKKDKAQIFHNALLAHGTACLALRAASSTKCNVSFVENYQSFIPVVETPENIQAAQKAFLRENGSILIPILTGHYDEGWLQDHADALPHIAEGDMQIIGQPLHSLGCNCYSGRYIQAADNSKGYEITNFPVGYPVLQVPWLKIAPESMYWGIRLVRTVPGQEELPIYISENGCPDVDATNKDGDIKDIGRIMYYRAYLSQLLRAVGEGYPVIGFFAWSLLDNFEWADGYSTRFGLIHVNFKTQERHPKSSYYWYQQVIRQGKLV